MSDEQTVSEIVSTATEQQEVGATNEQQEQTAVQEQAIAESKPDTKEADGEQKETVAEPEQKETHDVRRMKKLLREKYEAQAERDALRAVIERQNQTQQPQIDQGNGIVRENYNSDAEYISALVESKTREATAKIEYELIKKNEINAFQARVTEAKKEIEDYDEVLSESTVQFSPVVRDAIITSPMSAYVAYELAKDQDLAERIASMPPAIAAREIGKLEAKLEARKENRTKAVPVKPSKAPEPIKPLSSKGNAAPLDPSKMSDAEWLKWEHKRIMEKNKR